MVMCLGLVADLHTAQLMPVLLTVSCFSKIQIGFTFLVPAHLGSSRQRAVKRVCVCVCVIPELCWTDLQGCNKSTRHDAFISHARQRHDLIGCREDGWCLATFVHISAYSNAAVHTVHELEFS